MLIVVKYFTVDINPQLSFPLLFGNYFEIGFYNVARALVELAIFLSQFPKVSNICGLNHQT